MKLFKTFNILKWALVWTASWSMTMAPVAMGQEAKKISKTEMQSAFDQMGLNKQITLGEFYQKNKYLFPERIRKEIEPIFMANKNVMMPTYEVLMSKNTNGQEIPTVRVSQGNELINLQWFGEKEKMLKFQNTNLSEIDVINFTDMYTRISAGDERFRKQLTEPVKKSPPSLYPDVSAAEWKNMSPYNRANYIVNMRSLWQDARAVLRAKDAKKTKTKKTSFYNFEQNPYYQALFSLADANAAESAATKTTTTVRTKSVVTSQSYVFNGNSCIVAGYVASYEVVSQRQVCNHTLADKAYAVKDNSLYNDAKAFCQKSSQIACNPYVFGTPNGSPTCVTPSTTNQDFQKASHWDGPCDSASRLSTSEIDILKDKSKNQGRYEDGNLLSDQERKELLKTDQGKENYKLTEDYLFGLMKFRGLAKTDSKGLFDVMSDQILAQIKLDKQAFEAEINEATKSCKAESAKSKTAAVTHEKNYWQACDQLHSRQLFINELFTSKCESKSLNPDTLKCKCTAPATNEVLPGAKCSAVNPMPAPASADLTVARPASPDNTEAVVKDCAAEFPDSGATSVKGKCVCANGQPPTPDATDGASGMKSFKCGLASSPGTKPDKKDECGILCKIGKGLISAVKFALPWLVTGVVAYAAYKLLAPKKPSLKAPTDKCPDGSIPPCGQVCTAPLKKQTNGTCSCDGCPPGQTPNATTCLCSTGTTPTTTYLCPDSTTRVANLDNCPTYSCWNGQSYQNPMNCPTQTPTTTPPPTGTGTR
ncbi:MAG: hypothetical protein ABL930_05380 [Pseudobdellovibrio sp.]